MKQLFFSAQKFLDSDAVDFRQLQDLPAAGDVSTALPIHQGRPGNAALLGHCLLRQPLFFAKQVQPCTIRISARFWFPTHASKDKRRAESEVVFDNILSKTDLCLRSTMNSNRKVKLFQRG